MGYFNKADVLLLIGDNVEWISAKKFTADFNQIDKRWVDAYAKKWKMPDIISGILKKYCGESGYRPVDILSDDELKSVSDRRRFTMNELPQKDRETVLDYFESNKKRIIRDVVSGTGRASAKWMLIVEEKNGAPVRSAVIPIGKVISYCMGGASITNRGTLRLGGLTIQRKGGDAGRSTAQMLQFKFSPSGLFGLEGISIVEAVSGV